MKLTIDNVDFTIDMTEIIEPPQITGVSISNVTTVSGSDGSITVTATGVNEPLTYSIGGDFQSSNVFTGLSADTYTLTVKDSRDNEDSVSGVRVSQPVNRYVPVQDFTETLEVIEFTEKIELITFTEKIELL